MVGCIVGILGSKNLSSAERSSGKRWFLLVYWSILGSSWPAVLLTATVIAVNRVPFILVNAIQIASRTPFRRTSLLVHKKSDLLDHRIIVLLVVDL